MLSEKPLPNSYDRPAAAETKQRGTDDKICKMVPVGDR
jgi:hypothetical protein